MIIEKIIYYMCIIFVFSKKINIYIELQFGVMLIFSTFTVSIITTDCLSCYTLKPHFPNPKA